MANGAGGVRGRREKTHRFHEFFDGDAPEQLDIFEDRLRPSEVSHSAQGPIRRPLRTGPSTRCAERHIVCQFDRLNHCFGRKELNPAFF